MNAKLTLKLDEQIIKMAKGYAKNKGHSLSELVENYFRLLVENKETKSVGFSEIINDLDGIIKLPKSYDRKREYSKYLAEKYNK